MYSVFPSLFPLASMTSAYADSTISGQVVVWILFLGSAIAWTIMLQKGAQLSLAKRSAQKFMTAFRAHEDPLGLYAEEKSFPGAPMDAVYQRGCRGLFAELEAGAETNETPRLTPGGFESVRAAVECAVADEILELEEWMGGLAIAVSAAPFMGLLGTVWGVMDAFGGMAKAGNAALSAVAPGISGALLTTIVGLFVALPSMVGYNLLSAKIRTLSVKLDNFAQEFVSSVKSRYANEA